MSDPYVRDFGDVTVRFQELANADGQQFETPWLMRDVITVPWRPDGVRFHVMATGDQFVLERPGVGGQTRAFFGGLDEAPFLVELQSEPALALHDLGERGFYDELKPQAIRELESAFGEARTVRQGDIYAYQLPCSWQDLEQHCDLRPRVRTTMPVGKTRHKIVGTVAPSFKRPILITSGSNALRVPGMVAEGRLTAPDHADRGLTGPHLLAISQASVRRRLVGTPHSLRWLGD